MRRGARPAEQERQWEVESIRCPAAVTEKHCALTISKIEDHPPRVCFA